MNSTILHTPTSNLAYSLDFYKKLNFKVLSEKSPTLLTDGKMLLEINPKRSARAGVKIYGHDWTATVEQLKQFTHVLQMEGGFFASDPNGVWVYLINGTLEIDFKAEEAFGITGNFMGVSIEATDVKRTARFWQTLGYEKTMGSIEQGWLAFSNKSAVDISIMKPNACPHLFFNPSFTFFNGKKNLEIIQKIRAANIPITEEITHFNKEGVVDNIIIQDPGGYGFFIFND